MERELREGAIIELNEGVATATRVTCYGVGRVIKKRMKVRPVRT